jgi:penicillin-binding protein-related factor A (putative recombinase)
MAKKPETLFKEKVRKALDEIPNSFFEKIQQVSIRGTPDFVGCIDGMFIAIELKKSLKDKPDALQEYKLSKIAQSGGIGFVVAPENFKETYQVLLQMAGQAEKPKTH